MFVQFAVIDHVGIEDQVIEPQDVVDVQSSRIKYADPGQVPGGAAAQLVAGDEQYPLASVEAVVLSPGQEFLGLAVGDAVVLDQGQFAFVGSGTECHGQTEGAGTLRQRVTVVTRLRAERLSAAHEDGCLAAAVTGPARTLLRPAPRGCTDNCSTGLGAGGAATTAGELPADHSVQDVLARFRQVKGDLAV